MEAERFDQLLCVQPVGDMDSEATAKQPCDMRRRKEGNGIPEQAAFSFQLEDNKSGPGLLQC